MNSLIIVGIGNLYRGDDAAGLAVIDQLKEKVGNTIKLAKQRGDIAELIDIFTHHKSVYLVDACQMRAPLGSWQRVDLRKESLMSEDPQTSTHGFGVSQAVLLAKNLNQLPEKLILYAICGNAYQIGDSLSPAVANSVDTIVKELLNEKEIQICMSRA